MSLAEHYDVIGRVATTRTGAVWKARDRKLDRFVAMKEVPTEQRDTLQREAAALAAIAGEHVVAVYGIEDDGPSTFLVEEWVDGATLAAVVRANGAMPVPQALGVMRGALLGLYAAHLAGLVHGDMSASNILIDTAGRARLIDFGSVATTGAAAGPSTGAFAAPEVVAGWPVTPAADVYAAAAVFTTLVHGRLGTRPTTRGLPGAVRTVIDYALAADPQYRYQDAGQLLAALEPAAQQEVGADWWTQAGLGAAATAGVAALVPIAAVLAGGAAGATVAGAGAAAVATGTGSAATVGSSAGAASAGAASSGAASSGAASTVGSSAGAASTVGTSAGSTGTVGTSAGSAGTAGSVGSSAGAAGSATASTPGGATPIGRAAGRIAWHSRRVLYAGGGITFVGVTMVAAVLATSGSDSASSGKNLVVDGNAESARTSPGGAAVHPVAGWTVESGNFTAAKYGDNGLPAATDPGPPDRGKNLFTGGESGDTTSATQVVKLGSGSGGKHFTLSAWLGGYAEQGDSATVQLTWRDASGATLGQASLPAVTEAARKGATGLFKRTATGSVPSDARTALVRVSMTRTDGAYVDGYVDDVSLTLG